MTFQNINSLLWLPDPYMMKILEYKHMYSTVIKKGWFQWSNHDLDVFEIVPNYIPPMLLIVQNCLVVITFTSLPHDSIW